MKMDLKLFAGGHSVTILKDGGITSASASSTSDVAKNTEVTLTVTPASGYAIAGYEVLAGGVTVNPSTKKFVMGEADVTIVVQSKAANKYMVTEECYVSVNETVTRLHKNAVVVLTPNGVPKGVTVENGGATISSVSDAIQNLIDQGILIPM